MGHGSNIYENDEGWWVSGCICGWEVEGLPDQETAIDIYGEHMFDVGVGVARGEA